MDWAAKTAWYRKEKKLEEEHSSCKSTLQPSSLGTPTSSNTNWSGVTTKTYDNLNLKNTKNMYVMGP